MSRRRTVQAWAIVDAVTDTLLTFDHRAPVYWLRKVARDDAHDRGLTSTGRAPDVRIERVRIQVPSR